MLPWDTFVAALTPSASAFTLKAAKLFRLLRLRRLDEAMAVAAVRAGRAWPPTRLRLVMFYHTLNSQVPTTQG